MSEKLCVNCAHLDKDEMARWCRRESEKSVNLVTGAVTFNPSQIKDAWQERYGKKPENCGREAKFFHPSYDHMMSGGK